MLFDAGVLKIYTLKNTSDPGAMPAEQLVFRSDHFYGERTVGYGRQYAAMGVSEQVDMLVRIWRDSGVRIGMYAVPEDGEQYRINNAQQVSDEDGLPCTDLSLRRLDRRYDVAAETKAAW